MTLIIKALICMADCGVELAELQIYSVPVLVEVPIELWVEMKLPNINTHGWWGKCQNLLFQFCLSIFFSDIDFKRMWEWILSRLRRHHHFSCLDFDQCTLCQFGSIRRNGHLDGGSQFVRAKLRAKIRPRHRESHASRFCLTKKTHTVWKFKKCLIIECFNVKIVIFWCRIMLIVTIFVPKLIDQNNNFRAKNNDSFILRKMRHFSWISNRMKMHFFWKIRFVADFNDPTILNNDIGLVRLENDISFTKFINPLCLPPMGETGFGNSAYGDGNSSTLDTAGLNIVGKNATVIGWGAVNDGE